MLACYQNSSSDSSSKSDKTYIFKRQLLPVRGIGEGLTRLALGEASENGAERLSLLVFEDNQPAKALYRKMGFRLCSIPRLGEELQAEAQSGERRRIILSRKLPAS